ncbi:MAG TPA: polysaccharide biosynthesis/export family protein [Bacteroidales bacterium]|nr:polysaccharide biosynthesis/export family protein [Bacteroidales bacterium]HPR12799.1 polysaccharide biosynthesis/export family protein [Bacteroidales bacterium]
MPVLTAFVIIMIAGSCVSRKKLTYLQYNARSAGYEMTQEAISTVTPSAYKIMTNDYLFVRVITPDPQWSALFNMQAGDGSMTQESAALSSYPVDTGGEIEIPYVGKIKVAGKTLSEIKQDLESVFKNYLTDYAITVRMVDNNISIIGEVNAPGRYPITKDRLTVFEALAMAGDLSVYSNRQRVQLLRPSPYGPIIKEFSLSDRSILDSEYYYVMPNDVIYAMPMRGRSFQLNTSIYTLFLTTISTALVIISYFRTL